ncbi:hypothetical protein TSUD_397790 [Trifolium subterraneum]|uniref:Uncharacterized protein n=1 Tax=Trifolium subterraneum TaxID=3900 RepID=A0A2Z6PBP9_TRISU|nr:hypothetical protein TSUD_397790 [Trifolium subterraneum]
MERNSANDGGPATNLQAAVGKINRLKAKMTAMEQEKAAEIEEEAELDNIQDSQPLAQALWDAQVPANFKIPQLPTFEGKTDPLEHLMAVDTQTAIKGVEEHLKSKLLSSTFKDAALRCYMNLPRNSIASYTDFHKMFIHQFAGSKHVQVTVTSLFGIRQGHNENLREYLTRFNEATIQVSNPNQEMFVAAVQNGLKAGHFNESLAQKPVSTMQEIMKRAKCYIKGEESNAENRSRDLREKPSSRRVHTVERLKSAVLDEILSSGLARLPLAPDSNARMGANENAWCHYHRWSPAEIPRTSSQRRLKQALTPRSPRRSPPREDDEKEPKRIAVNTIAGGFAGGGDSKAARKRYLRRFIQETNMVAHVSSSRAPEISFSPSDGEGVFPHDDNPLVIQVQILNCDVKRVLIDSGSSADIMYWEAFKAMQLVGEQLQPYNGTLVGFGGEQVEVMGHVTLLTTFGEKENAKTIKVRYLVVKTAFTSYNIIIGCPAFNTLGAVLSTLYMSMKYPLDNGRIGTIRGDQAQGRQCYELSLRLKRNQAPADQPIISRVNTISRANMVETSDLDPREEFQDIRIKERRRRSQIIEILRKNVDLFAWKPSDMPGIDESIITHKLAITPNLKPVSQRKGKVGEERRTAIDEEVHKLKEAGFIEEIKYPEWLANVVLVKKSKGKWRMCVDFTDLNKACPKDPYPLPSIDRLIDGASDDLYPLPSIYRLIDGASDYKTLSFMDAYSGYNQIKMNTLDAPHTTFMSNTCNYHYTVMSFGLKNTGATYQLLMDRVFAHQIGKNFEVYIDDMVVKTTSKGEHHEDLKDILASRNRGKPRKVSGHNRYEKPNISDGRATTHRANNSLVKVPLMRRRKGFPFLHHIEKWREIYWSDKCEEAFQQLKVFLASPPILTHPQLGSPLYLYLVVSENSMSSALVQDIKGEERPVYFVSTIFRGAEIRYKKIEKLSLAVITTARRLRHYFQSHKIVVKTDHPIKHVLKKPNLVGRMVAWAVELSEYDITFVPRGNIKSQILEDIILELSSPPEATNMQPWTLSVDGASNIRGSGAGVVLEGPDGVLIEQSLRFAFKASNNQAEYEALIARMRLGKKMKVADLREKSDSHLVTSQVSREFQAKDPQLIKYLEQVRSLAKHFNTVELIYVPREQNARTDLLSKLASTKKPENNRTVIQETVKKPSTGDLEVWMVTRNDDWRTPIIQYLENEKLPEEKEEKLASTKKPENNRTVIQETVKKPSTGDLEVWMVTRNDDWRTPIIQYLENEKLPEEKEEKVKIKKMAAHYTMVGGKLYKRGFSSPMLLCVGETKSRRILNEIHNGSCGSHIGGRSLAGKVTRAGFFWPTLLSDANRHVRSCDQCQRHADLHHAPGEPLQSVMSPWPFYMWGVDILGPFTTSQGQAKFLLVAVDYFTKVGIPKYIVYDNGTQFTSESVINFCQKKGIRNTFISVEQPQANGQAESTKTQLAQTQYVSTVGPPRLINSPKPIQCWRLPAQTHVHP